MSGEPNVNPYAAPQIVEDQKAEEEYYVLDIRAIHFAELWSFGLSWMHILVYCLYKVCNIRAETYTAMGRGIHWIDREQISESARVKTAPHVQEIVDLGYKYTFSYSIPLAGRSELIASVFLSPNRKIFFTLMYSRVAMPVFTAEELTLSFNSVLENGDYYATTVRPYPLPRLPHVHTRTLPNRTLGNLLSEHESHLDRLALPAKVYENDSMLFDFIEKNQHDHWNMWIARGILIHATETQLNKYLHQQVANPLPAKSRFAIDEYRVFGNWTRRSIWLFWTLVVLIVFSIMRLYLTNGEIGFTTLIISTCWLIGLSMGTLIRNLIRFIRS